MRPTRREYHLAVTGTHSRIADEVSRYLCTGDVDLHCAAWPGGFMERVACARDDLRQALVREVTRLAGRRRHQLQAEVDAVALTRRKVEPMVRGLFARVEQDQVLAAVEKSVVFLTSANIESLILGSSFDRTA